MPAAPTTGSNNVNNGHPADKYGWALAGGAKFNLAGRRHDRLQRLLLRRRSGLLHQQQTPSQLYNNSNSVGLGWIADGVFTTGTDIELTKVWSALAGYEHIWNPKWRTSVFGGYVNVQYSSAADQRHPAAHSGRVGRLRRRPGRHY